MSGPKGIEYRIEQARIAEQRDLAAARTEWSRLEAQARRFEIRCEVAGQSDLPFAVTTPSGDSAAWRQSSAELRHRLDRGTAEFDSRRRAELGHGGIHDLGAAIDDLQHAEARRIADAERVAAQASVTARVTGPVMGSSTPADGPSLEEIRTKVDAELGRLLDPSPELVGLGRAILSGDPRRSRLQLADLSDRVSAANRQFEARRDAEGRIDDLRARVRAVLAGTAGGLDPEAYLDRAEAHLAAGADPEPAIRTATDLIAVMERRAEESVECDLVRGAVEGALSELGYAVAATEVETAETLYFRPTAERGADHLVRVGIDRSEIDIRSVRTRETTSRTEDMAADEALCADLPGFVSGLARRGLEAGRIRRTEAGVVTPPVVVTQDASPAAAHAADRRRRRANTGYAGRGGAQ